jgi:hypothetical protein
VSQDAETPTDEPPVLYMDEAGNTGENLLDTVQPVYALAAVRIDEVSATRAVAAALSRTQMPELKFNKLQGSGAGRRNILTLLGDLDLQPGAAAVAVAHKPWMLAAKLVDELVEARMLSRGEQMAWYASGDAKTMADVLYQRAPRALGTLYEDLAAAFVPLVRDYSPQAATDFLDVLRRCRIACTDAQVSRVLHDMIDTDAELKSEFATREDALDPALPLLFWQGAYWSRVFEGPFRVLHDDSNTVRGWVQHFTLIRRNFEAALAAGDTSRMEPVTIGQITLEFPTQLQQISFGESHRDDRLQVADTVAGAAAHLYAVATGARQFDTFARDLRRAGIGDLIEHEIGPQADASLTAQLL